MIQIIWGAILASAVLAYALGRPSVAVVCLATLVLSLLPLFLAGRLSLRLPMPFLLSATLFIFASLVLGEAFDFYNRFWWWDLVLHGFAAFGFGLIGFLFVFMLFEGDRYAAPPLAIAFITFCVAMTAATLWELFEFAMDQLFGLNMQKSGLDDTMGDLIVSTLGGGLASFAGYLFLRPQGSGWMSFAFGQFIALNKKYYRKAVQRFREDRR